MGREIFTVMLAASPSDDMAELKNANYPLLASFKLDGIRMIVRDGKPISRSGKTLPSHFAAVIARMKQHEGLDGELVVRDIRPGFVYTDTFSAVMTHGCTTLLDYFVFDNVLYEDRPFKDRLWQMIENRPQLDPCVKILEQKLVYSYEDLLAYERKALDAGFEGLIVRDLQGPYKYGRSTLKQGYMTKMVRYETSEAVILGLYEGLQNNNEAVIDSRGYTTRSKHIDQMVGKGLLGGFNVRDVRTGMEFKIGAGLGLDMSLRKEIWDNPIKYIGRVCKYKFKPYGVLQAPRQPIWIGWRDPIDM